MLKKIRIQSFKSLVDVEVELGVVNVFIGANGSGKSNFLEAIGVLGAAASGRVDNEALLRRGVRLGLPSLYKASFPTPISEQRPHILLGASSTTGAKYEVTLWNPITDPAPAWQFKTEILHSSPTTKIFGRSPSTSTKGAKRITRHLSTSSTDLQATALDPYQGYAALRLVTLPQEDAASQLVNELRDYSIYFPNTPTLRGQLADPQAREPMGLSGGRLAEALDETLSARSSPQTPEVLEALAGLIDWAKKFSSAPASSIPSSPAVGSPKNVVKFVDRYMNTKRNTLSGYDASEGALYVLFAAILALHPRSPAVLALDNVDQALNPRLAKGLMSLLCEWLLQKPRQWLVTSHNPAVLDGLPLRNDAVRLFVVDRNSRGHTVIRRIEVTEHMDKLANEGWTLSRMWTGGLIGGVPSV